MVDGDNLRARPWEELDRVQDFLGLPHRVGRDNFVFSASKGFYCFRRSMGKDSNMACMGPNKGLPHPEVGAGLRRKLEECFREPNQRLFQMLGREFDWRNQTWTTRKEDS